MKKIKIPVEKATGKILPHDITEIVPGKFKGPAFKKGHIIRKKDIEHLKKLGKRNIYLLELEKDEIHEDEAGKLFKTLAGKNVFARGPSEGKIEFIAKCDGLAKINSDTVHFINSIGEIVFTTIHSHIPVKKGETIAGIRIVPLAIKKSKVMKAIKKKKIIEVSPFKPRKIGLIVTGSEVASGKIKDRFRPVIEKKAKLYRSKICRFKIVGDDEKEIRDEIVKMSASCDFIILTGGMSVDPDDSTKVAIRRAGAKVVSYGAPILPGNMFMVAYLKNIPIFGVPACALFYEITVLDIFLPYVFSNTKITKEHIIRRGYGGLCRHCRVCVFPACAFGKI